MVKSMKNFQTHKTGHKLQQAVLTYIASQLTSKEETEHIRNLYMCLDKDGDGILGREELRNGF